MGLVEREQDRKKWFDLFHLPSEVLVKLLHDVFDVMEEIEKGIKEGEWVEEDIPFYIYGVKVKDRRVMMRSSDIIAIKSLIEFLLEPPQLVL